MKRHWMHGVKLKPAGPPRELHVIRAARERYQLEQALFTLHGTVIFADFQAAQQVAHKMNQVRDAARFPEQAVRAGELYAAGLIDEVLHLLFAQYRENVNPNVLADASAHLAETLGEKELNKALRYFSELFPATPVYRNEISIEDYMEGETDGMPHRQVILEELLMLYLANENPAFERLLELFDDSELELETAYTKLMRTLNAYFDDQPSFPGEGESLIKLLRAPALHSPTSLEGQLSFLRRRFAPLLGERFETFMRRLVTTLDTLEEERRDRGGFGGGGGPAPSEVMDAESLAGRWARERPEYERFSPDRSWMPRVVLLAKSTYVWLDQLSKQYQRDIHRLDQIPDEELDELARRGFTGLWLIGLWERSEASRRIKHLRGNPDAVASAYALYDYVIAQDLGGESAYENLRERTWQRGIRLASDMVPNHVGIDGRWVIEHPDWFLSLDHPPYPGYTFEGPDLCADERAGVYIEDHYYDGTDAAVVFKRVDRQSGDTRYIYHGNDGTSMPWNDTAQLNYLSAEVREGVIQTILHVARKFSIIRFDAAMTLAKQHIQRLWFPEPGQGGAIPSRAQHGSMTFEEFERAIPKEFWREVVDRVAEEVPDTLLLAEAFWMMEGYFVRTLGMHRVYNSAFMNMLKREENAKYRQTIKNVLEFDPEILKRFVNFMNNPDEETAEAQFGRDGKYFGVCTLMITMPGLPMFGHGQVEGFTEKYGMEYRRPKYDEQPDQGLIERHRRDIFPLLHRRHQFAEVENFLLYDFYTPEGEVNENVYAYTNRVGSDTSLVLFHNAFADTRGWIKASTSYAVKRGEGKEIRQRQVAEGLGLQARDNDFVIFRELHSGLEYLRPSRELADKGFYTELQAFDYRVILDIREVEDNVYNHYRQLEHDLAGRGVPSIADALAELRYKPLHEALEAILDEAVLRQLQTSGTLDKAQIPELSGLYTELLEETRNFGGRDEPTELAQEFESELAQLSGLPSLADLSLPAKARQTLEAELEQILASYPCDKATVLAWMAVHHLGLVLRDEDLASSSLDAFDRWRFRRVLETCFSRLEGSGAAARRTELVRLLTRYQHWYQELPEDEPSAAPTSAKKASTSKAKASKAKPVPRLAQQLLRRLSADDDVLRFWNVNQHEGVRWFNKEAFDEFTSGLLLVAVMGSLLDAERHDRKQATAQLRLAQGALSEIGKLEQRSQYRLETLISETSEPAPREKRVTKKKASSTKAVTKAEAETKTKPKAKGDTKKKTKKAKKKGTKKKT